MAKSVVSIVKGTEAEQMIEEALSLLGGLTNLIKPNSTIVVKPNAGHPVPPGNVDICIDADHQRFRQMVFRTLQSG